MTGSTIFPQAPIKVYFFLDSYRIRANRSSGPELFVQLGARNAGSSRVVKRWLVCGVSLEVRLLLFGSILCSKFF